MESNTLQLNKSPQPRFEPPWPYAFSEAWRPAGKDCVASRTKSTVEYSRILVFELWFKNCYTLSYLIPFKIPTSRISIIRSKHVKNVQQVAPISEQNPGLRGCSSLRSPRTSPCQPLAARRRDLAKQCWRWVNIPMETSRKMWFLGLDTKRYNETWTNTHKF